MHRDGWSKFKPSKDDDRNIIVKEYIVNRLEIPSYFKGEKLDFFNKAWEVYHRFKTFGLPYQDVCKNRNVFLQIIELFMFEETKYKGK